VQRVQKVQKPQKEQKATEAAPGTPGEHSVTTGLTQLGAPLLHRQCRCSQAGRRGTITLTDALATHSRTCSYPCSGLLRWSRKAGIPGVDWPMSAAAETSDLHVVIPAELISQKWPPTDGVHRHPSCSGPAQPCDRWRVSPCYSHTRPSPSLVYAGGRHFINIPHPAIAFPYTPIHPLISFLSPLLNDLTNSLYRDTCTPFSIEFLSRRIQRRSLRRFPGWLVVVSLPSAASHTT
jgi:hypothetical protein